jgi:hypothetical protein
MCGRMGTGDYEQHGECTTGMITPVFLFSLPRSGSTLTQRVLATHQKIDTAAEPWILLPFLYSLRREGVYAEYGHKLAVDAIEDFADSLPGGRQAYLHEIRAMALRLYTHRAKPQATYFLDKSPRYHLVAEEIIQLFEAGRFIFLWRNPLSIISSMMETWAQGKWNLYSYDMDLHTGLSCLIDAWSKYSDRAISVKYEDLVSGETSEWRRIFEYLGLEIDECRLNSFSDVALTGRMGDPTGIHAYLSISDDPTIKWEHQLGSPVRKAWCRRYLRWIGKDRLSIMGYDLSDLLNKLDSLPNSYRTVSSDLIRMTYGSVVRVFEPRIIKDKLAALNAGKRARLHR